MTFDRLHEYLLSKTGSVVECPFGPDVLVFKVANKMFAAIDPSEDSLRVNLKCDPERALDLRAEYEGVVPGYHMSKRHWNTVYLEADVSDSVLRELVDHSYDLVVSGLSRVRRDRLRAKV